MEVQLFIDWLTAYGEGRLLVPNLMVLTSALIHFGAKNENLNGVVIPSLRKYSNAGRAPAMRTIWGHRFDMYKADVNDWLEKYEIDTGKPLPTLKKSGNKTSGMIQIFGEITALAYGALSWYELAPFLNARRENGILWQEDKKEERIKLVTPNAPNEDPILVSSIPPGFEMFLISEFSGWTVMPWVDSDTPEG